MNLANNNIGNKGCRHLRNAKWEKLTHLEISILIVIE